MDWNKRLSSSNIINYRPVEMSNISYILLLCIWFVEGWVEPVCVTGTDGLNWSRDDSFLTTLVPVLSGTFTINASCRCYTEGCTDKVLNQCVNRF